ncbi:MAG: aminodeoxychorismate lyase, partial [Acidiferrobacteraceae bacterium]
EATTAIDVRDRGLVFGDGVFETLAVVDGQPLAWNLHVRRLSEAAKRLGLTAPPVRDWERDVAMLAASRPRAVLKLILTRGIGEGGYRETPGTAPTRIAALSGWRTPPEPWHVGAAVTVCRQTWSRQPSFAGIKHLGRLEQVRARGEWTDEYAEGLMRDDRGDVISGTASNLFLWVKGLLVTPDLSASGIWGTVRAAVMNAAQGLCIPCVVRRVPLTVVIEHAEEVFLTNSLIGVWPVVRIGERGYPVGPVTLKLRDELVRQGLVTAP